MTTPQGATRLFDFVRSMERFCGRSLHDARSGLQGELETWRLSSRRWGALAMLLGMIAVVVPAQLLLSAQAGALRFGLGLSLLAFSAALMALRAWDAAAGRRVLLSQLSVWDQVFAAEDY
ncbi:MAG TPA: hypothetical protein VGO93_08375 [Candidatus Xenobia bacterium]